MIIFCHYPGIIAYYEITKDVLPQKEKKVRVPSSPWHQAPPPPPRAPPLPAPALRFDLDLFSCFSAFDWIYKSSKFQDGERATRETGNEEIGSGILRVRISI